MIELPSIPSLTDADNATLQLWAANYQQGLLDSLKPAPDAFGLRQLPREPGNPNKFLPTFKTDAHTYQIIGDSGIGFERYSIFQKRSIQLGFGRNFQQLISEIERIILAIGGEQNVARRQVDSIVSLTGLKHSIADISREHYDAAFWLCSLFALREDETVKEYSEEIAREKIEDWGGYGYSELDFFFLSGNMVPGYGNAFKEALAQNERLRQKLLDAIGTSGSF